MTDPRSAIDDGDYTSAQRRSLHSELDAQLADDTRRVPGQRIADTDATAWEVINQGHGVISTTERLGPLAQRCWHCKRVIDLPTGECELSSDPAHPEQTRVRHHPERTDPDLRIPRRTSAGYDRDLTDYDWWLYDFQSDDPNPGRVPARTRTVSPRQSGEPYDSPNHAPHGVCRCNGCRPGIGAAKRPRRYCPDAECQRARKAKNTRDKRRAAAIRNDSGYHHRHGRPASSADGMLSGMPRA